LQADEFAREDLMRAFVATLTVLSTVACFAAISTKAHAEEESCYTVRATAEARNPQVATERAENRLHRHIADELRSATGKRIGPVKTQCIRNSCKASTVVCHKL
jgi:low affinity Fe/Cu permease